MTLPRSDQLELSIRVTEGNESLASDPVNAWTATLILAAALDLGRAGGLPARD